MKRPHYAWVICVGGALAFCAGMGLVANLFALFLPDIITALELTKAQGSWLTTIRSLFTLAAMLVVNQLCARLGLRQVISIGCALVGLSYLLLARAGSYAACCIACAILGFGYCMCGPVPVSLLIGRWFESRRSLALGLASAGSGLVTIIAPPILTGILARSGLSAGFVTVSVLAFVFCLSVFLLIRNTPESMGLTPYRQESAKQTAAPVRTVARSMTTFEKGLVLLATLLMAAPAGPGFAHVQTFFRSEGYAEMLVASLTSFLGFVLLVGKILCGQVYDRLGGRLGNFYIFGLLFSGHVLFLFAPSGYGWLAFLSVGIYGMGIPISSVATARWASDLNDEAGYASAVRSINLSYSLGSLIFGPLPGTLADRFGGSYVPSYILFGLMLLVSLALLHIVYVRQGAGKRH